MASNLALSRKCLHRTDGAECYVIRARPAPVQHGVSEIIIPVVDGRLAPSAIVAALAARGLWKLLIEGGAATVSQFVDARALDRLHVLVAPVLLGRGKTGLDLAPIARLSDAIRPRTEVHLLSDGDVLFDCDLRLAVRVG